MADEDTDVPESETNEDTGDVTPTYTAEELEETDETAATLTEDTDSNTVCVDSSTDNPQTQDNASETDPEVDEVCAQACKLFCKTCKLAVRTYKDKFRREVVKSVVIFLLALKLARECHALLIPLHQYTPFG